MPDGQLNCPFCGAVARQHKKSHPDTSADDRDCARCGIFRIARGTRMAEQKRRDRGDGSDPSRDIRAANESGFVYCYPSRKLIPDHPWLAKASGESAPGEE